MYLENIEIIVLANLIISLDIFGNDYVCATILPQCFSADERIQGSSLEPEPAAQYYIIILGWPRITKPLKLLVPGAGYQYNKV